MDQCRTALLYREEDGTFTVAFSPPLRDPESGLVGEYTGLAPAGLRTVVVAARLQGYHVLARRLRGAPRDGEAHRILRMFPDPAQG